MTPAEIAVEIARSLMGYLGEHGAVGFVKFTNDTVRPGSYSKAVEVAELLIDCRLNSLPLEIAADGIIDVLVFKR